MRQENLTRIASKLLIEKENYVEEIFSYLKEFLEVASLDELLNKIIEDVPRFVNGIDCSIYLLPEFLGSKFTGTLLTSRLAEIKAAEVEIDYIVLAATSFKERLPNIGKAFYRKGEGLTGWIFEHGEILRINDMGDARELRRISKNIEWSDKYGSAQIQYEDKRKKPFIGVPLKGIEGEVFGVIKIPASQDHAPFTRALESIILSFASLLSSMIQRTKLIADKDAQVEDLLRTGSVTDNSELLQTIVQTAMRLIDGKQCALFMSNNESQEERYYLRASAGRPNYLREDVNKLYYKKGEGATGWIAKHGEPLIIKDITDKKELKAIASDLQWKDKGSEFKRDPEQPKAFLGVPLFSQSDNKVIGVIRIPAHRLKERFHETDKERLEIFAKYVVLLLQKATLLEEKEFLVNEFFQISGARNVDDIFKPILNIAKTMVYDCHCSVFRLNEQSEKLILNATSSEYLKSRTHKLFYRLGEGLTGFAAKTRCSLRIENVQNDEEIREIDPTLARANKELDYEKDDIGPFLVVPVISRQGKIQGVIRTIRRQSTTLFTPEDQIILETLANHLSLVIERTREIGIQKDWINKLIEIGRTLNKDELLSLVVEEANDLISGNGCSIFLKDTKTELHYLAATSKTSDPSFQMYLSKTGSERLFYGPGKGKTGKVIESGEPLILNDIRKTDQTSQHMELCETGKEHAKKFLAVPIKAHKEVIGVIRIPRTDGSLNFTNEDLELLDSIANQVALVIRNAELFSERERRVQALETISELSEHLQQIDSELPQPEILEKISYLSLTCLTITDGLRFNRAIMFKYDQRHDKVFAEMGIGELETEDADRAWHEIANYDFRTAVEQFNRRGFNKSTFNDAVKDLVFTNMLNSRQDILKHAIVNHEPIGVKNREIMVIKDGELVSSNESTDANSKLHRILKTDTFALVPLIGHKRVLGAIYVDNKHSGEPIGVEEIHLAEIVANQVAKAIENTYLIAEIKNQIDLQKHQLNEQVRMVESISANFAHRMSNLAGTSRVATQILRERIPEDETSSHQLLRIEQEAKLLLELAERITRPFKETGKIFDLTPIDIKKIINHELQQVAFKTRRIIIANKLDESIPEVKSVDFQLRQVIHDILNNAIEAMQEQDPGKLEIRSQLDLNSNRVEIEISDSGPGIPDDLRAKLFAPGVTTKKDKLGIGLWWCRTFMQATGGDLVLKQTRVGHGATFSIKIPCVIDIDSRLWHESERKEAEILIVDDQEQWLSLLLDIVKDEYSAVTANSYEKALEALTGGQFKLAIIDIRLIDSDEMNEDGLRLLEEIDRNSLNTQVIILTGFELEPQQIDEQKKKARKSPRLVDFIKKRELDVTGFRKLVRRGLA